MYESERGNMVGRLIDHGYIKSSCVASAFRKVERHRFMPHEVSSNAYVDTPQPIGFEQTISAPHMVAIMTELLDVREDSKVLEIGTGSGYQAAIIAELCHKGFVYSVERVKGLYEGASRLLSELGYSNIHVVEGDGTMGLPEPAPYDRIIVTAAAPRVPGRLVEQLSKKGRMLVPVGGRWSQDLVSLDKDVNGRVMERSHGGCVFVPLLGEEGW
ncbi:MAG: protein-L-isoaspartate(D-aspartate) O-methyltransferase [Candidatus Altiarchaeota archaeon]